MAADSVTAAINKVKIKAGIQKLLGWIIAIFNGLIAFVGSTQISEALDVVLVTFFAGITALGIFLIYKGSKKTKLVKAFYDYSARLAADPEKSIDLLASSTGVTVAAATKNISEKRVVLNGEIRKPSRIKEIDSVAHRYAVFLFV